MAFSGVSSQGWGGKRVPVAGSTDWAGLMVHLGPNPNTSGKFPVSSTSAWHSHASAASWGSDPRRGSASPLSHLPGTCQVSPLTHDTAEPAPGTGSLRPTAACRASVSPWRRLRSGRTFSSHPKQSRPPCRLARDTLSQRECNVLPAVPHRRLGRARLYKYPSLGTHRTQSPAKSRQRPASLSPAVPPATQRSLPQHPDTRSRPQPLPALRNTRRSHGRLKIKAEKKKRKEKGVWGLGYCYYQQSGQLCRSRSFAWEGRRRGRALPPRCPRRIRPPVGGFQQLQREVAGEQQRKGPRGAATCQRCRSPGACPLCCPGNSSGSGRRTRRRRKKRRRGVRGAPGGERDRAEGEGRWTERRC